MSGASSAQSPWPSRRRFLADPSIAARVKRPTLAPTAADVAPSVPAAVAATRIPMRIAAGELPAGRGILGLWADRASARTLGVDVGPIVGDSVMFIPADTSMAQTYEASVGPLTETVTSPARQRFAARLTDRLALTLRPYELRRGAWDLDWESENRLTDWLEFRIELGWWVPPPALRASTSEVYEELADRHAHLL